MHVTPPADAVPVLAAARCGSAGKALTECAGDSFRCGLAALRSFSLSVSQSLSLSVSQSLSLPDRVVAEGALSFALCRIDSTAPPTAAPQPTRISRSASSVTPLPSDHTMRSVPLWRAAKVNSI